MTSRPLAALLGVALVACGSASPDGASGSFPAQAYAVLAGDAGKLSIEVRTAPTQPPSRGTASVELRIVDRATSAPVDGLAVSVVPWMTAMSHGASVQPVVIARGQGAYVVDDVDFFMPGHWELRCATAGATADSFTVAFDVP